MIPCAVCGRESNHDHCREHDPDPERRRVRFAERYYRRRQGGRRGMFRSPYHQLYRELGRHFRRLYTGAA